jgi:hypothetical protein
MTYSDNVYPGGEDANRDRVRRYLKATYTEVDGTVLSDARLTELLTDQHGIVERGLADRASAYYVGDQIAEAAGLLFNGDDLDANAR